MSAPEASIYGEASAERARQDTQWGSERDDSHRAYDWNQLVERFNRKAMAEIHLPYTMTGQATPEWRRRMIQVAALAVAAVEWYDRAPD